MDDAAMAKGDGADGGGSASDLADDGGAAGSGEDTSCYVLFDTSTDAMALFCALKEAGVGARISPTPRMARTECGTSLLIECPDRPAVKAVAGARGIRIQRIAELPAQINPKRDRYC